MAAHESLGLQFSSVPGHVMAKHPEHGNVGEMLWEPGEGDILDVSVHPEHRRKGIASAMLAHARSKYGDVHHDTTSLSAEGAAWAKARP